MDKQQRIKSRVISMINQQGGVSIVATQTAAVIYVIGVWDHAPSHIVLIWLILFSLLNAARYFLIRSYSAQDGDIGTHSRWLTLFRSGVFVSGSMWGGLAILILPLPEANYTALTILIIAGLASGSVGTYVMDRITFVLYTSASILPLCAVLMFRGGLALGAFAALLFVYYIFMTVVMFRLNTMVKQGVLLQFEKEELLYELEREKTIIEELNQVLEKDIAKFQISEGELLTAKNAAESQLDKVSKLTMQDGLTEIANRRCFNEFFSREWQQAIKHKSDLALIMIDIDNFKLYNDHYGHPEGDAVLRRVARVLEGRIREASDLAARYGGEEFVIVLPDTSLTSACKIAEQIRQTIEALQIPHLRSQPYGVVTASLGASSLIPATGMESTVLMEQADKALYEAKNAGRNRVYPLAELEKKHSNAY